MDHGADVTLTDPKSHADATIMAAFRGHADILDDLLEYVGVYFNRNLFLSISITFFHKDFFCEIPKKMGLKLIHMYCKYL